MENYYLVANIKSVFGSDGFMSLFSYSDFPDRFFNLKKVFIDVFGDYKEFFIETVQYIDNEIIIKLKGFDTDQDIEFLLGKNIFVESVNRISLPEDTYFIHDLIGSKVYKKSKFIGSIIDVINLSANDVYVIKDANDSEILIPAIKDYIKNFNPEKKELELNPENDLYFNDEN